MLHVERRGEVIIWTVDRPRAKNALDSATLDALVGAIGDASEEADIRAAVLTGAGDTFVSGGDLRELRERHSQEDAEWLTDRGYELTSRLAELPFPVIAALPGPAIGGGAELAVACDIRVADARARICFKQVRMGVTTAWGTASRLADLVGAGTAARLLYTAHPVNASEAKQLGLVDEVTEDGRAREVALAWASDIALGSPTAIAHMKSILRRTITTRHDVRSYERRAFVETWTGPDRRDASQAFFEGRPPRWTRRVH